MLWKRCSWCAATKITSPGVTRAILLRCLFALHLHPRDAADDIVNLVFVVRLLQIVFAGLQHVDAATHRGNTQKFLVGTAALNLFADLIDRVK